MNQFDGLGVAMVTPFKADGAIDFKALEAHTQFLIDKGVNYLVVQGTTGEAPTLSASEKQGVLDCICSVNDGQLPVVFGIGGNNTTAAVRDLSAFDLSQVAGILSVSPYYNKPTQEGIYQHYKTLAAATPLPLIVYNVPARTGSSISPQTTVRMAEEIESVVAVKEASGDLLHIMEIIANAPPDFHVISGDDALAFPSIAAGARGVISVVGNALPHHFNALVRAALEGDLATARNHHYAILPILSPLFKEGNPAGVKELLCHLGWMGKTVRLPLVHVSPAVKQQLVDLSEQIEKVLR